MSGADLTTERRANLADTVFEKMKAGILSGEYEQGKLLPTQEALARHFGVSRTVMRDAFHKLSSLGLVEIRQGRGSSVRSTNPMSIMSSMLAAFNMDASSIRDLMEARYYLERCIIRLAAARIEDSDLDILGANVDLMDRTVKAGDIQAFAAIDLEFHEKLAEISGNKILQRTLVVIRGMMKNFFDGFSKTPGVAPRAVDYHKAIFAALRERDPDLAESMLKEHLGDIISNLKKNYDIDVVL